MSNGRDRSSSQAYRRSVDAARHLAQRRAEQRRERWKSGRLWPGVYAVRSFMLLAFAAAAALAGAPLASVYILSVVLPYNTLTARRHRLRGRASWLLSADQVLAGFAVAFGPAVLAGTITCQLVGAMTAAMGRPMRSVQRFIVAGSAVTLMAGAARHDRASVAFAVPAAITAITIARVVDFLQNRNELADHRYEELLDGINALVMETDATSGRITYVNRGARELIDAHAVPVASLLDLLHVDDRQHAERLIRTASATLTPVSSEVRVVTGDEIAYMELRTTFSTRGDRCRVRNVLVDVSGRKHVELELAHRVVHDELTQLPNRVLMRDRLEQALRRSASTGAPIAVMLCDLDNFKDVNDGLGHLSGDRLLIEVGRRLHSASRATDTVARLGGDEFAVIIEGVDRAVIAERAAALRTALSAPYRFEGVTFEPSGSIGIAMFPDHGSTHETLLRCADIAMYRAKRTGDGVCLYDATVDHIESDRVHLVAELRTALHNGEMRAYFQPLVDSRDGRIVSCEALVRWQHPTRGLLPPSEFVPVLASAGLSSELARWMLQQAIEHAADWYRSGHPLRVAVNLSARDLADERLLEWVTQQLDANGLPGELLAVELTESELLSEAARTISVLSELGRLGVKAAVDDFGTGYSSLVWLRDLPVTTLKIDRSFVNTMCVDERSMAIVRSTIDLAKSLELAVIGEGVENVETANALAAMGCTSNQGFLYSCAVPPEELAVMLHQGTFTTANG